ncbi:MAG: DUF599 domain-containing protein [Hyphomicrobiaceae bacterium]
MLDIALSNPDLAAFLWFVLAIFGYRMVAGFAPFERRSIVGAVQRQREAWMRNMVGRDGRIVDVHLLGTLGQGNAFFASTSALIIGGLSALLGSGEKLQILIERLPYVAKSPPVLIEMKLIMIITIFVYSFFKFAWAFRLSHYASIMIGATPLLEPGASNAEVCEAHATRTARLIGIAAEHSNSGLRGYYYAIAGLAWFFHPLVFAIATTWVILILLRRDFFSRSRRLIAS